jgi:ATP-dependent helicase/nuclease subunit A
MTYSEATLKQQHASNPASSIWVAASAGSGKTKVLVDRVLRLLLQNVSPDNILCITYTTAAAAEMLERITRKAREWTLLPEEELRTAITDLQGHDAYDWQLNKARRLFLMLADAAPGLRVLTIHAFCQNMLNQFPIEAGIAPHFTVIEEEQQLELLHTAKTQLFKHVYHQKNAALSEAIDLLSDDFTEYSFDAMLDAIIKNRRLYAPLLRDEARFANAQQQLYHAADIPLDADNDYFIQKHFGEVAALKKDYDRATLLMMEYGSDTSKKMAEKLLQFFARPLNAESLTTYVTDVILTNNNRLHKHFISTNMHKYAPDAAALMLRFGQHAEAYKQEVLSFKQVKISHALLIVAHDFFRLYEQIKREQHALDFDDLIMMSLRLLENKSIVDWVLYKLDGQIDHILIDEAQDTSKEQWALTHALTGDFFAGQGAKPYLRSVFVVGDEKQSIFRFQGAAPEAFSAERDYYANAASQVMQPFAQVDMHTSFRSLKRVLSFIDEVFAPVGLRSSITSQAEPIKHVAHRADAGGQVVLYPAFIAEKTASRAPWSLPHTIEEDLAPEQRCADTIANQVKGWLDSGRILPATNAPIAPCDILILVRRRGSFVDRLSRAMQHLGIPVAGSDRLTLNDHIAVKDMLALCRVLIDVHDDMSLVALMTSPLYNIDYPTLTELCSSRTSNQSVWQVAGQHHHLHIMQLVQDIAMWRTMMHKTTPYTLLCHILFACDGMNKYIARMGEPVRDVLHNLLYKAEAFSSDMLCTMQHFIAHMEGIKRDIRRNTEQGINAVRIMTIHGAKGLEAPVVILPDTMSKQDTNKIILLPYHRQDGTTLMLHKATQAGQFGIFSDAVAQHTQAEQNEYNRLLYVALSRAEDELHIFGYLGRNRTTIAEDSWYGLMRDTMQRSDATITPNTDASRLGDMYRLGSEDDAYNMLALMHQPATILPVHLQQHHTTVTPLPVRFSPSEQAGKSVPRFNKNASEWAISDITPKAFGTLVHYFFELQCGKDYGQFLKDLPSYIQHGASTETPEVQHEIHTIFLRLAKHDDIVRLLNRTALAEVPIHGIDADNRYINGVIDRLIIEESCITIIDFKSGTTEADDTAPEHYAMQLRTYKTLLTALYPKHEIICNLVYYAPMPKIIVVN